MSPRSTTPAIGCRTAAADHATARLSTSAHASRPWGRPPSVSMSAASDAVRASPAPVALPLSGSPGQLELDVIVEQLYAVRAVADDHGLGAMVGEREEEVAGGRRDGAGQPI